VRGTDDNDPGARSRARGKVGVPALRLHLPHLVGRAHAIGAACDGVCLGASKSVSPVPQPVA